MTKKICGLQKNFLMFIVAIAMIFSIATMNSVTVTAASTDMNIAANDKANVRASSSVSYSLIKYRYQAIERSTGKVMNRVAIARINVDGTTAFCVQPGVSLLPGGGYSSETNVPYITAAQQEKINKYLNFADTSSDFGYMATQALIWDTLGWTITFEVDISSHTNAILAKVDNFDTLPSINNQTIEIKEGATGGQITDSAGVLNNYTITGNTSAARVTINGNTLNATVPVDAKDGGKITLSRGGTKTGNMLFWVKSSSQTVTTAGELTPKKIDVNVSVKRLAPKIKTTATDKETATKETSPEKTITIVDTVTYVDLKPGKEYVMMGILMDKLTGEPLLVNGKEVVVSKNFIPTTESGTVELEFTFEALALAGKEVVVFERLYLDGVEVTTHTDINDEGQTVKFKTPEISTTATEKNSGEKEFDADDKITVVDVVEYKDLIIDKEYTLRGILMSKATGEPLLVNGKTVESEVTFVTEETDGTIEMEFTFDACALGGQELVVFEDLYRKGDLVISHADINDLNQTVKVKAPEIKTTAKDKESGSKKLNYDETVTIVDTVTYKGLIVGKEYTIEGVLMRKDTNKPLVIDGKKVTATKTFTPKTSDGSIELEFTLNTTDLEGIEIVVFEKLYRRNILVASHTDINDKDQTVQVKKKLPESGNSNLTILLSTTLALMVSASYLLYNRRIIK